MVVKRYKVERVITQTMGDVGAKILLRQFERLGIDSEAEDIPDEEFRKVIPAIVDSLIIFLGANKARALGKKLESLFEG